MGRRIDWHGEPDAPAVTSVRPSAGAFVRRGGEVLLIERTDNGNWSMPGGAMDPGESLPACAVRETVEETGVQVEIVSVRGLWTDPDHRIEYTSDGEVRQEFTVIFEARYVDGEPTSSSESSRVAWVGLDQVEQLRMHDSQRRRLRWCLAGEGVYFDPA